MPISFSNIRDEILSGGIDARNAENQIDAGFVRDALNVDVVQKYMKKRRGYVGFAGNIPVRVVSVDSDLNDEQICFTLDQSISLINYRSTPIVVHGRLSTGNNMGTGTFNSTTDVSKYYPRFTQNIRNLFLATGNPETLSIPASESGLTTPYILMGVQKSLSDSTLDNEYVQYNELTVDSLTNDIDINYINNTGTDVPVFVYYLPKAAIVGSSYVSSAHNVADGVTDTYTITEASHQLGNFNMIIRTYQVDGTDYKLITPDSTVINPITGQVDITVTNNTGNTVSYFHILSAAPAVNTKQGSLSGSTYTITIDNPDSPFIFPGIYVDNAGMLEEVGTQSIVYNSNTNQIFITFENPGSNSFVAYWEYGEIRSNVLCVTDEDVTANIDDSNPQLTIWGLDHSQIYRADAEQRAGWANHIDSYRSLAESRLVSGLGGNLFSAQEFSEAGATYKYGTALSSLVGRTSGGRVLAPAFWQTGETPERTRGYVTGTGLDDNWATVTAVEYDNGLVKYTLTVPGLLLHQADGTIITTNNTNIQSIISQTSGLQDYLTVEQMSYARHNGTFRIAQIEASGIEINIWCENNQVDSSDYDDDGVAGSAGVFTDRIVLSSTSEFIPGDVIVSDAITNTLLLSCLSSSSSSIVVDGVVEVIGLSSGVQLAGKRTSHVVSLRGSDDVDTVENFVAGDLLSYSRITREVRVLHVNTMGDTSLTFVGDGSEVTATLVSGDTRGLAIGQMVLLRDAGDYTGEQTIQSIPTEQTFTFSNVSTTPTSGVLAGKTITLNEPVEWRDSSSDSDRWTVERRWIPVEAPDDSYDGTPSTRQRHFNANSYDFQPFLRSSMVNDNLYLTNYDDAVQKYDGTNVYRSGLPQWQPGAFLIKDTTATAKIVTNLRSVAYTAPDIASGRITVATNLLGTLALGTTVLLDGDTETYTISSIDNAGFIFLDRALASTVVAGNMRELAVYKYYYRLSAIDANNNIIASAVAQSDDYIVQLSEDAAIHHKLIGLPAFDNYDYDSIYVQVYRTLRTGIAPYYRVFQQRIPFNKHDGYIQFTDTLRDSNLLDLDPTSTLKGGELGIGWSDPLRAKCITSAANTAVYGNLRDVPQLDLQFFNSTVDNPASFSGSLLFRRDATDLSSDLTNMLDRVRYTWTPSTVATDFRVVIVDTTASNFTVGLASAPSGLSAGDWVYLYFKSTWSTLTGNAASVDTGTDRFTLTSHGMNSGDAVKYTTLGAGTTPTGITSGAVYYVERINANEFKLYTDQELSLGVNVTAAGTGSYRLDSVRNLSVSGWHQVASGSGAQYTFRLSGANHGDGRGMPTHMLIASTREDVPIWAGDDGNFANTSGNSSISLFRNVNRLALAINATMRRTDRDIAGQSEFTPWLSARAGNDMGTVGRCVIRQPQVNSTSIGMKWLSGTTYSLFLNNVEISLGTNQASQAFLFPSRILIPYANFPEIVDSPTAVLDADSDSAVDVNPADGQEITAVTQFFGSSVFGASQQSSVIVVFKEQSIYLVDANEKRAGNPAVQKIETEGIGCTAPNSVSVTKNGIIFANESGIYVLRRDLSVDYIGKFMERHWSERVDRDLLGLVQGHHYTVGRQYKLSVPLIGSAVNSEVFVYDHSNESAEASGAWTRYDNHPATGWCNLGRSAFFSSSTGRVFQVRDGGDKYDYQDDADAINMSIKLRPNDFGIGGGRKVLDHVTIHYRTSISSTGTQVLFSTDTEEEYTLSTGFVVSGISSTSGLSDIVNKNIQSIQHNTNRKRGIYFSVEITNDSVLESAEIAGLEYRVGALTTGKGLKAARDTQ